MRYIIETQNAEDDTVQKAIDEWKRDGRVEIVERADLLVELQANLEKVGNALEILKKAGYNSEVMKSYLKDKTGMSKKNIDALLKSQESFFKQIGVVKR